MRIREAASRRAWLTCSGYERQSIQPYDYGEDASKETVLLLKNLPKLKPTKRIKGRMVEWPRGSGKMVERWANQTDSGQNKLSPSEERAADRGKTYPGIADAMADQWGDPVKLAAHDQEPQCLAEIGSAL